MEKEVLIIDDDKDFILNVKKCLTPLGYRVLSKGSVQSGLKAMKDRYQLILLEIALPDGNGLEALSEIKSRSPDSTIIIIKDHGMEKPIEAMKHGAYGYIEKPLDHGAFRIVIDRAWNDMVMRDELKYPKENQSIEKKDVLFHESKTDSIQEILEERLNKYLKQIMDIENADLYETIISEVEKALITIVLKETKGNQLKASRKLGINRNTLRAKIKEYHIPL